MDIDNQGSSPRHVVSPKLVPMDISPSKRIHKAISPTRTLHAPQEMHTDSPSRKARVPEESPLADNEDSSEMISSQEDGMIRGRSRKSTERFVGSSPVVGKAKKITEPSGAGIKLGDITKIADKLYKVAVKDDALKRLHKVLYGSDGTATSRKKEIRLWNGTFNEGTIKSMAAGLAGAKSVAMLKDICSILSLSTGGDRAGLEARIFDFLVKPSGSSAPVKAKKVKKVKKEKNKSKPSTKAASVSSFSLFVKKRLPEIKAQAGSSMSARDVTELLTMEWASMSSSEKAEFAPHSPRKELKVHKVIEKSSRKKNESSDESSSSSDSSSSDDSSDSSSDSD